jgi:phage-related protein (TIGR01555 family)
MMKPYVDNWLQTRQAVNDIIQKFRTTVLSTDMDVSTMAGSETFFNRIKMFVAGRNNSGVLAIDKNSEAFQDVTASLASLDKLQAQSQEHMATPAGIPLIKIFGITPTGLNASAEPEMQTFAESLSSSQEKNGTPIMRTVLEIIQLSKFGEIDPNIGWKWNPLKHLDKKEEAEIDLVKAQADDIRINNGTIDTAEAREALAHDEDGPYPGLDLNYTPEIPDPDSSGDGNEPTRGIEGSK